MSRLLQGDKHTDGGILLLDHAAEIVHVGAANVPALDLEDYLLRLVRLVVEEQPPVNPPIGPFLLLGGTRAHEPQRPILELEAVLLRQRPCAGKVLRLANDLILRVDALAEGALQPILYQVYRQVGDVNSDPAAIQLLRNRYSRSTAAERVEDGIPLVAARHDYPFQQCLWLLGGIAQPFSGHSVYRINVAPDGPNVAPTVLLHISLQPWFIRISKNEQTVSDRFVYSLLRPDPMLSSRRC